MAEHYKTVVQGEASESSDEDDSTTQERGGCVRDVQASVVVEGEASESEEEELDSTGKSMKTDLPPVSELSTSFESIDDITSVPTLFQRQVGRPKYDTVLNRKLWESNLSLCNNLNGLASQAYLSAAKDITNCGHQLSKSHAAIQDVSHNMRLLTNDLLNLDDRIDIITTCKLLPSIVMPEKAAAEPSQVGPATATASSPQDFIPDAVVPS